MKAQRITIRHVNKQHGQLPENTVNCTILLIRTVKGRNGFETERQIIFNRPCHPRMDVMGWTHYAILPGYLQ